MIEKRSRWHDFFVGHLYDNIVEEYGLENSKADSLVNYLTQFHGGDRKKTLLSLYNNANPDQIEKILGEIARKEQATEITPEPAHNYGPFALPAPSRMDQHEIQRY